MAEAAEVLGLKVLYEGQNSCVDIVAVHGLGATPDWAWIRKVEDGNRVVHVNWLKDTNMLPAKLPDSRIMVFNYESKWLLNAPRQSRSPCAEQMLTALDNKRREEKDTMYRPLIFIGHSFGGVLIEQSLVNANSDGSSFQHLASSTVGVLFLGTPHRGTQAGRWGEYIAKIGKNLGLGSEDSILKDLREGSESLRDLLYQFTLLANRARLKLLCFFEQHRTDYGKRFGSKWTDMVVDEASACIDGYRKVPLPTDHFKINKYSGPDDPSYRAVYPLIIDMAREGLQVVEGRVNPQKIVKDNSKIPIENLKCLQSLFLTNPPDDLAAIRSAKGGKVHGTCEWILAQAEYTSWLSEESPQLLWVSGGPGIGKTMISTFLVGELEHTAQQSPKMTFLYYFCDDKYKERRTATAIVRGILLQLLRQRPILFRHIQDDFDISRDSLFINFHALWRIYDNVVKDPEAGEVCCLIDALDECEKESRQLFLTDLSKSFCSHQSTKASVKYIITSRREIDIAESLSPVSPAIQNLQVDSGKVHDDLFRFIDIRVDELSTIKEYKPGQKDMIKRILTEKAGGTFLYVSLILYDLKKTATFLQVKQKLQKLPSDLDKVYDRILGQVDAECEEIASLILSWVAGAVRPLTVDELAMALALGSGEREKDTEPPQYLLDEMEDAFKCCIPLVYFKKDDKTINLVHQSAKDYLLGKYLQNKEGLSQYHVDLNSTNVLIFRTCWTYLSLKDFKQGTLICHVYKKKWMSSHDSPSKQFLHRHCFLWYASGEWQKHALAASPTLTTDIGFTKDNLDKFPILRDTWLLQAAHEGQEVLVQRLLEEGAGPEVRDEWGRTPLLRAAERGNVAIVKLLLSRDDVLADSQDRDDRTPLSWAAENGYEAVVKLLLSRDDVVADLQDEGGYTPLMRAAERGHTRVIELLLSREDVVADSLNKHSRTPLFLAAQRGHKAVVELLSSRDDVAANAQDIYGRTALSWAAIYGYEAVVECLISRDDVIVDARGKNGQTPLFLAAEGGHEGVMKLFLSRDDVAADSRDNNGRTPLSWAASAPLIISKDVSRLLLDRDDVAADSRDNNGRTPLSWAAGAPLLSEDVPRLLLDRDDVAADSRDNDGRTPLSWAASAQLIISKDVSRLLLDRDDVAADSRDNNGRTPLSWAAGAPLLSVDVPRLLLDRDDVAADSRDNNGRTPLSWAAELGRETIVRLLLSRDDVEADSRDNNGRTPLSWAAANGNESVVKLLEQSPFLESEEGEGSLFESEEELPLIESGQERSSSLRSEEEEGSLIESGQEDRSHLESEERGKKRKGQSSPSPRSVKRTRLN